MVRGSNSRKRKGRKGKLDGRDPQASIKLREENVKSYLVPFLSRKWHLFPGSGVDGAGGS